MSEIQKAYEYVYKQCPYLRTCRHSMTDNDFLIMYRKSHEYQQEPSEHEYETETDYEESFEDSEEPFETNDELMENNEESIKIPTKSIGGNQKPIETKEQPKNVKYPVESRWLDTGDNLMSKMQFIDGEDNFVRFNVIDRIGKLEEELRTRDKRIKELENKKSSQQLASQRYYQRNKERRKEYQRQYRMRRN